MQKDSFSEGAQLRNCPHFIEFEMSLPCSPLTLPPMLSQTNPDFLGLGFFSRCAKRFADDVSENHCGPHVYWSYELEIASGDKTHSEFRNVVSKFALHNVQKPENRNTVFHGESLNSRHESSFYCYTVFLKY
jgi:hypothetical protein